MLQAWPPYRLISIDPGGAEYVGAVLGFFYLAPSGAGRGPARTERAAFARAFGLSDDAAPVVAVDLGARGGAASPAFRLG